MMDSVPDENAERRQIVDFKTKQELLAKLDETDKIIREGISAYDTLVPEREHLKKAREQLQGCITEILSMK